MKKIIISIVLVLCIIAVYFIIQLLKKNENVYQNEKMKDVVVDSPKPNSKISSPLMVRGMARGMWFFEAVFPITLINKEGKEIITSQARAEGDWMTEKLIPFSAEIIFPLQNKGERGTLILKRDNPSGLPENDASVSIPVIF
jgi:hypothetical protein